MSTTPPQRPPAGWYPDPSGVSVQRWWDGQAWSAHTTPTQQATPAGSAVPASGTGWGAAAAGAAAGPQNTDYSSYAPRATPLAPSGMRWLSAMFSDLGRIGRRAWLAIIGLSLIVWAGWTFLLGALSLLLIDYANLTLALTRSVELQSRYPSGEMPAGAVSELSSVWSTVPRTDDLLVWTVIGVLVLLATFVTITYQLTAVNQLGLDAASGREVRIRTALRRGWPAAWRMFGYLFLFTLLFMVAMLAVFFIFAAGIQLDNAVTPFLVPLGALTALALFVALYWVAGRLIPLTVQVLFGGGALSWSWRATRGRFWAVVGRYLLWSLIASIVIQLLMLVVMVPAALALGGAAASGNVALTFSLGAALMLLFWPVMLAISAISYLGVVPIWRDLTDHPDYRAIDEHGIPLPE